MATAILGILAYAAVLVVVLSWCAAASRADEAMERWLEAYSRAGVPKITEDDVSPADAEVV